MEALMRGSIPVLRADELDLYGIELADGHNCSAVERGLWAVAIERLAGFPESLIAGMRENVLAMRPALEYRQVAKGICRRLGLEPEPMREHASAMGTAVPSRR